MYRLNSTSICFCQWFFLGSDLPIYYILLLFYVTRIGAVHHLMYFMSYLDFVLLFLYREPQKAVDWSVCQRAEQKRTLTSNKMRTLAQELEMLY